MRFLGAFTALLTLAAALPSSFDDTEDLEDFELMRRKLYLPKHPRCSVVGHVIVVSELSQPRHGLGTMANVVQALERDFPGTTNFSIPYPKDPSKPDKIKVAKIGTRHVRMYVRWYSDGCPHVPLIFLSYSEGSLIASNGLCGRSHIGDPDEKPLADKYARRTIASVFWGDPSFTSGQTWDKGNCFSGHGVNPRQTPSNCNAFGRTMQSYCVVGDPVCCSGNDYSQHYVYQQYFYQDSYNFVHDQYRAWQEKNNAK